MVYNTTQSLNFIMGHFFSKLLCLWSKSIYNFVAIGFWHFSKNADFQFYMSKGTATRRFQTELQEDKIRRVSMTGTNIEVLIETGKTR